MATYNTPLITNQGLSLLKAEIAGNDSVTFTKIVFSSDDYSQTTDSSVQALTALSSLDLTATARSFTDVNGNLKIRGVANNQNTTAAFYIKTYGLYGKNKAGNEMLIAVSTAQNANFVPAYNGKQTNQIAYTFNIAVSSTNNITLSSSTDVDVTQADLAGINNAVNSNASSLTAQQSSYASSLNSAFSSNTSSLNSAFSANSSNTSSYVSSTANSLTSYVSSNVGSMQSQVSSNANSIAVNSSAISELQTNAVQFIGNVPTAKLEDIPNDGIYNLNGGTYPDGPVYPIYGVLIQTGSGIGVKAQRIINNLGNVYYRAINGWGIKGWYQVSTEDDISSINSSLASMATQAGNISSSVSANSTAIANNVTITSSAISSVSSSNNAVSSSIASTVSVNQSNIANNSSAISNLQSSVASNSSAISNATSLASTANSNAVGAGLSVQTLESDTFRFQGKINNSNLDVSNYQNGVSNGWWSLSGVTINGLSGFSGYGIMSRTSDIYNITSNSGSQSATYVQVQVIDSLNETIYYNIFSYSKWVGWKQVATADGTLQFMGAVPGNTLSQVVNSGIYDLQGRSFTDYTNNIWGQLIVTVTGGVVNQTIRNNTGNMWIESVNGWGISGWKQVV